MEKRKKLINFLEELRLPEELVWRAGEIYNWCAPLCPDDITGVFVGDYVTEQESREFDNLWFFSEGHAMQAKGFMGRDDLDIMTIRNRVAYVEVQKEHYDTGQAAINSRLNVRFTLEGGEFQGELRAAAGNCDRLWDVLKNHVMPNLTR